ncbi:DUF4231 domain-containing protein [Methylomonas fluvii]|uniref:DUF4231 domain-containing protein n=1 Tax=Methylomonas fluvii TaxID=1854564 RepID=A0ABR9D860_9GAMM|nr:DUF4231 domain-containing protein [Methylomonas fluvii]MBD9358986.1 DUF4231 domain-containing protein [Methylomonas fluvii]
MQNQANQDRIEYLYNSIDSQISSFRMRRQENKRKATHIKIFVILLGAMTTIALGLQVDSIYGDLIKNIALIFSSIITAINTIELFFNYRALWIRYTQTTVQLYALKAELDFLSKSSEITEEQLIKIFNKLQSILAETNLEWTSFRKDPA